MTPRSDQPEQSKKSVVTEGNKLCSHHVKKLHSTQRDSSYYHARVEDEVQGRSGLKYFQILQQYA